MAVLASVLALVSVACSHLPLSNSEDQGYLDAGEDLIGGDLSNQIGLGPLEADCQGRGLEPGDTFTCTGVPTGHDPIMFVATISADGQGVDLVTTNLLLAEQVEQIETFAAALIAEDTSLPITNETFECADNSLVVPAGGTIDCLVTDPSDQTIHTVAVTVEDLSTLTIAVDVGDPVE